jgi:drug/metabolite transporter (DMT)-like permease
MNSSQNPAIAEPIAAASTGPVINRTMSAGEWLMLLALSILWGGSFFFIGVAVKELPTLTIVASRVMLAALILWAVLAATGKARRHSFTVWRAFFIMGLLNNAIPFCLIVWGQSHIASGVASILNATTPLFTVLAANLLTDDEKLTPNRLAGVLAGLTGVAVMIGGAAVETLGVNVVAQLAILGAAISYSCAGIFGRRFRALGVTPIETAAGQVTASSLMLLVPVMLIDEPWTLAMPGMPTIAAMLALASISTALAYIMFFRILATAGATNVVIVTFLVPVSAILLGIAFLGEALALRHLIGMALIGLGLAAIDGRPLKYLKKLRARGG